MIYYVQSLLFSLVTVLYASQSSLIEENFTGIANHFNHPFQLVAWSFLAATYFLFLAKCLFQKFLWQPGYLKIWGGLIYGCAIISSLVPYQDPFVHLEALHVLLSLGASIAFLILIQYFLWENRYLYPFFFQKIHPLFQLLVGTVGILVLAFGSINSLIELFLSVSLSFFLAIALNCEKK